MSRGGRRCRVAASAGGTINRDEVSADRGRECSDGLDGDAWLRLESANQPMEGGVGSAKLLSVLVIGVWLPTVKL